MGPLQGIKVLELEAIGPARRRAMRLADMGAKRVRPAPRFARKPGAMRAALGAVALAMWCVATLAQPVPAQIDWVDLGSFSIARTETTVAQFRRFVQATGTVTRAEREGGGSVYEAGWVSKPGWNWSTPFGRELPAADDEPAAHLTWFEADTFCRWAGARLPTDDEWVAAAYTEQRAAPPAPFVKGRTYAFPAGDSPAGAQCLDDCGPAATRRAVAHRVALSRGYGHARTSATPPGVNGLHDMGANLWEWVDEPRGVIAR